MARTRDEIIKDIKMKRPHLTDDEAKQLLETLEAFCELVTNYTMNTWILRDTHNLQPF